MPTPPTPVNDAPLAAPDPADRATFFARMSSQLSWIRTTIRTGLNALAANCYDNALEAATAAQIASDAAVSAISSPGASATSTTSTTVSGGSKTFAIQTGKAFFPGQTVFIARTSDAAATRMGGIVTAHNSTTGSLTVLVSNLLGSGTFTDWTISIGFVEKQSIFPYQKITASGNAYVNVNYGLDANNIALVAPTMKNVGDIFQWQLLNSRTGCSIDFGTDKVFGRTAGVMYLANPNSNAKLAWTGATDGWVYA